MPCGESTDKMFNLVRECYTTFDYAWGGVPMVGKGTYKRNGNGDGDDMLMFLVRLGLMKRQKPLGAEGIYILVGNPRDWTNTMCQRVRDSRKWTTKMSMSSKTRFQQ
jgi:hypothetical protein